mgnify:CR=1 FL=1
MAKTPEPSETTKALHEIVRLRRLVQEWRFTQHPESCQCKLCLRTADELPDLPYYPSHGLSKAALCPPDTAFLVIPERSNEQKAALRKEWKEIHGQGAAAAAIRQA